MPSEYHGADEVALTKMAEASSYNSDHIVATAYFLVNGGLYLATSDRMRILDPNGGWCHTNTADRVVRCLKHCAEKCKCIDWCTRTILDHSANSILPWLPSKGSIDTMPIDVHAGEHSYQPKYANDVAKIIAMVSNSGFVCQMSAPFSGTSHDQMILENARFKSRWLDTDKFLCDGVFAQSAQILTPASRSQLYPKKKKAGHNVHEMLKSNEMHAHFRARAEHCFSASLFNRFRCFSRWQRSNELLTYAVVFAQNLLNWELLLRHGPKGRYEPASEYSEALVAELQEKFTKHANMSNRYPEDKKDKQRRRE